MDDIVSVQSPGGGSLDRQIRRRPERGTSDRAQINAILDAQWVIHVGTIHENQPLVIPMFYVRDGDWLLMHGAPATGVIRRAKTPMCATVTVLDGFVMARSAFHHSMNYRSVVVIDEAQEITDLDEKAHAATRLIEGFAPGRSESLRPITTKELRATAIVRLSLQTAVAKIRSGPPSDDGPDYDQPIWAGVVPVTTVLGEPIDDPQLAPGIAVPDHISQLRRGQTVTGLG